jgi:hypothetical protein
VPEAGIEPACAFWARRILSSQTPQRLCATIGRNTRQYRRFPASDKNRTTDNLYKSTLHLTDSESSPGLGREYFLLRQRHTVHERLHRGLAITPAALMRALLVVVLRPRIEIGLQLLQRLIDLLPKPDPIALIYHGLMEPLADPVRVRMPGLRARVIDVLHGQVQFILMPLGCAAVLGPAVGQDSVQRDRLRFKERQHPIIQQIGRRDRRLPIIQFRKPDLAVGIDERLWRDAPDALERLHLEGVVGAAAARGHSLSNSP